MNAEATQPLHLVISSLYVPHSSAFGNLQRQETGIHASLFQRQRHHFYQIFLLELTR